MPHPGRQLGGLSSDAEQRLGGVEPGKVYCIGGIVDRAIVKGVTSGFAASHGLQCRRLPIREHAAALGMQVRRAQLLQRGQSRPPVAFCCWLAPRPHLAPAWRTTICARCSVAQLPA